MDAGTTMDAIQRGRIVRADVGEWAGGVLPEMGAEWGSANMAREDDPGLDSYCAEIERRVEQLCTTAAEPARRIIVYDNGVVEGATYVIANWADRGATMLLLRRFLGSMRRAVRERFRLEERGPSTIYAPPAAPSP